MQQYSSEVQYDELDITYDLVGSGAVLYVMMYEKHRIDRFVSIVGAMYMSEVIIRHTRATTEFMPKETNEHELRRYILRTLITLHIRVICTVIR